MKILPRYKKAFKENVENDLDEFDFKTAILIHVNDSGRITVRELGGPYAAKFLAKAALECWDDIREL